LRKIIKSGTIKNLVDEKVESYSIIHGLDSFYALKADFDWLSFNFELLNELNKIAKSEDEFLQLVEAHKLEDKHWRWMNKSIQMSTSEYEWFYFIIDDNVQGICNLYHPKPSKIDRQNIFYIEYLAVAPWNRKTILAAQKFKGVGAELIKIALNYSITILGYRPGFSLHSLPQAISYYEKIGMKNFGPDKKKQNLTYFEMEHEESKRFVYA